MSDFKVVLPTTTEEWQRDMDIAYQKGRADVEENVAKSMQRILDDEKRLSYEQGRADGYSQAENDYHKQTKKDRQSSYDCGYEQGRADQKEEDNAFFNFEGAWELEKKKVRADAINEFIKGCKATHDGLICNWDKPYGITFERMEEKAKEYEL